MLRSVLLLFLAKLLIASAATLVPLIDNKENGYELKPVGDGYTLSVRHPDGKNWRQETVQELPPGVLEVQGTLYQVFDDRGGTLIVNYEAGPNGNVAKYQYAGTGISVQTTLPPQLRPIPTTIPPALGLSPKVLISATG